MKLNKIKCDVCRKEIGGYDYVAYCDVLEYYCYECVRSGKLKGYFEC